MAIFSRLPYSGIKAFVCLYPSTRGQVGSTYVHLGLFELCARVRAAKLVPGVSIRIYLSEAVTDAGRELVRAAADAEKRAKRRLTCAFCWSATRHAKWCKRPAGTSGH